ncbi:hypothetical protein BABINDRAFT_79846 [Babjeviella inositovora NRRL Y-12698]|uniref:Uncharacterized protein n=1 Tax=Babjeviella inositovora NRRL Y-12698 TaxID=984486 RepID=A0A1E3QZI8_9ASCO|nr:uncharacterized protein BABINDRAFT_79846 [Babjeviella inositovora NRRL Y-12698]ODQ83031.1 hypothetical protein BABINDRAFT_79846 [Babjeviella inositovora NRRL Y-12698]
MKFSIQASSANLPNWDLKGALDVAGSHKGVFPPLFSAFRNRPWEKNADNPYGFIYISLFQLCQCKEAKAVHRHLCQEHTHLT